MKEDVKDKWVAALRSGKYKQGSMRLRTDRGYCCLGVLCEVVGLKGRKTESGDYAYGWQYDRFVLAAVAMKKAGINAEASGHNLHFIDDDGQGNSMSNLNDTGKTFKQIAKAIEKHWKGF